MLVSAFANAQSLQQENFDALGSPISLPAGWTTLNLSSPIGTESWFTGNPAAFTSFNGPDNGYIAVNFQSGAGTATLNNWLMAPPVTVQNGDEVSFYTRAGGSTYPDKLELRQSALGASSTNPSGLTNVGSYTTLCLTINPNLTVTGYPAVWTKYTYIVSGLVGQVSCRFALRYTVPSGGPNGANSDYIGVDAFQVKRPVANDLSLDSVTVPAVIGAGPYTFNGVVTNQGTNNVTSYSVTWQSSGALNTFNVTGVSIAPGATLSFTHSIPLNAVVGQSYALNFNIATVNGSTDGDIANNTLLRNTQVASGSVTFKSIIEKFTSSTCAPCASYNNATFNPFFAAQNQNFNYIAYQQNFPGAGDPYFTAESVARRDYYSINSITSLRVDGADYSTSNNQAAFTAHIASQNVKAAYFAMTATRDLSNNNAVVNFTINPFLSGNYVLHAAVIEKTTVNNVATNGETSFKHVMMKMIPDASGTPLTFTAGTSVSGTISASLAGTNIEEDTDLEVILFIQNNTTKEIMQSFRAANLLSTDKNVLNTVKIYPNPAQDFIRISDIEGANVVITDISGKTVINLKNISQTNDINVSELNSGIYFVNVSNEDVNQTIKFIKK